MVPDVMASFKNYSWPGNIREMENIMERAYIMETSCILTPASFPGYIVQAGSRSSDGCPSLSYQVSPLGEVRRKAAEAAESAYLIDLLERHRGKIKVAAAAAAVSPRQLHKLMHKYGIHRKQFAPVSRDQS